MRAEQSLLKVESYSIFLHMNKTFIGSVDRTTHSIFINRVPKERH